MNDLENLIASAAEKAGRLALARGAVFATAESCTAGGVTYALTQVPGSSAWVDRGFVVYTNEAKREMLGVSGETLRRFGAVSEQTAKELAVGALERSNATHAVAVSGIAGPAGAVPGKPVGTVCFGFARREGDRVSASTETQHFDGDRRAVREATVLHALCGLAAMLD